LEWNCGSSASASISAMAFARRHPVGDASHRLGHLAIAVGHAELITNKILLSRPALGRAVTQDQVGYINVELVRRHIGALGQEAHVAQGAGLIDLGIVGLGHTIELAGLALVDQVEQARETVTQIEAAATGVTDVELTLHLLLDGFQIIKGLVTPRDGVTEGGIQTAFTGGFHRISHNVPLGSDTRTGFRNGLGGEAIKPHRPKTV
jgi:hypothetical protein